MSKIARKTYSGSAAVSNGFSGYPNQINKFWIETCPRRFRVERGSYTKKPEQSPSPDCFYGALHSGDRNKVWHQVGTDHGRQTYRAGRHNAVEKDSFVCYALAYVDRVNVAFSKLGMQQDPGMSDTSCSKCPRTSGHKGHVKYPTRNYFPA
jgi:hypothetical protein